MDGAKETIKPLNISSGGVTRSLNNGTYGFQSSYKHRQGQEWDGNMVLNSITTCGRQENARGEQSS